MQGEILKVANSNEPSKVRKVKEAQRRLIKSIEARKLAFRHVLLSQGSETPGIDEIVFKKEDYPEVVNTLKNIKGYRCKPVKRVYIPKANGKLRPLGIPCQIDRAYQALANLALTPLMGKMNCLNSYGFIKYRSCADAVTAIRQKLNVRNKQGKSIAAK